jgi:hypothetical protein
LFLLYAQSGRRSGAAYRGCAQVAGLVAQRRMKRGRKLARALRELGLKPDLAADPTTAQA